MFLGSYYTLQLYNVLSVSWNNIIADGYESDPSFTVNLGLKMSYCGGLTLRLLMSYIYIYIWSAYS